MHQRYPFLNLQLKKARALSFYPHETAGPDFTPVRDKGQNSDFRSIIARNLPFRRRPLLPTTSRVDLDLRSINDRASMYNNLLSLRDRWERVEKHKQVADNMRLPIYEDAGEYCVTRPVNFV